MASSGDHYVLKGITEFLEPGESIPQRRDVDEWFNSDDVSDKLQVFVFLMGLREFQAMPPVHPDGTPNKLSFFQIAGIHGYPSIPWDENTENQTPGGGTGGYCTHNSILFPTWHRPYMLLFERLIFEHMLKWIENSDLDVEMQGRLKDVVKTWRLPYWDESKEHAGGTYKFPDIATMPFIPVPFEHLLQGPGYLGQVPNPMFKFSLPDGEKFNQYGVDYVDGDANYGICQATSRWPNSLTGEEWINGANNYTNITDAMAEHHWYEWKNAPKFFTLTLANAVSRLLSHQEGAPTAVYECFASTRQYRDPSNPTVRPPLNWFSLEGIHNNLHNWSGGDGHMADVPVAAFDPLFLLHHCNIDRLFALWQNIWGPGEQHWLKSSYPDSSWNDPEGNWSTKPGSVVTSQTPLAPFRFGSGDNDYYTSDDVKDWSKLGYTYSGLPRPWHPEGVDAPAVHEGLASKSFLQFRRDVVQAINQSRGIARNEFLDWAKEHNGLKDDEPSRTFNDYVANVTYNKYALDGKSYIIHFILGDASKSESGKILIGERAEIVDTVYNFAGFDPAACDNCRKQREQGALSASQVSLNRALLKLLKDESVDLNTLDEEAVTKFLNDELKWFVTDKAGQIIDIETLVPQFEVQIAVGEVKYFRDPTKITTHGNYRVVPEATATFPGGLRP
ncbi:hypothetical protein TWF718_009866 [Orbilia javanica]|uniref:tyrosinase n=1 Tax=Orbilia javanica TaxID=47235 RepID=A0AAN8MJL4_9PEZI